MMKIAIVLQLVAVLASIRDMPFPAHRSISIEGVQAENRGVDEIRPALVNDGDESIYLLAEDCGEARVLRLNELTGRWVWSVPPLCPGKDAAIEIKPGERYTLPALGWRPMRNVYGKVIESNHEPGSYRLIIRYSSVPSDKEGKWPRLKTTGWLSQEFRIIR